MRTGQTVDKSTSLSNVHSGGSRILSTLTGTWGPRAFWLAVAVAGTWSIGGALDGRSGAVRTTVTIGAWLVWGTGVVALVVPSALGLTAMRMMCALACGVAAVSWGSGASPTTGASFVACALIFGLLAGGAEFGQRCVQASAYGDEHRFLLRPPAAFLPPMAIAGVVWAAAVIAAPLLLAAQQWISGGIVALIAVTLTWVLLPRFNALSQRWFVVVPAGVVLHDQVVLAETVMFTRADLMDVDLALADTAAADFTGPAAGHAIEISLGSMATVLLAPTKESPKGRALHVQSFIIAPSRPGAVLLATHPH